MNLIKFKDFCIFVDLEVTFFVSINQMTLKHDLFVGKLNNWHVHTKYRPKMPQKSSNPSDQVDNLIGHFGWYVGTLSIIASFVQILEGMNSVVSVFISAQTDYRCETCFDEFLVDIENSTEYEHYDKLIVENFYKIKEKSSDKRRFTF